MLIDQWSEVGVIFEAKSDPKDGARLEGDKQLITYSSILANSKTTYWFAKKFLLILMTLMCISMAEFFPQNGGNEVLFEDINLLGLEYIKIDVITYSGTC